MLGMLACLVFVAAGCGAVAVIATSLHDALPRIRAITADRAGLASDRVFLVTLIETPRREDTPPPRAVVGGVVGDGGATRARAALRRQPQAASAPLRAAA